MSLYFSEYAIGMEAFIQGLKPFTSVFPKDENLATVSFREINKPIQQM